MPNPTPTTREREAAGITKIALKYFRDNWQLRWALEQDIAAALAEAERGQMERDCSVVMRAPELYGDEHDANIRAAYAARLRGGEK